MATIQTSVRDDRGEVITLDHNDARYWEGPHRYIPFPKALYRYTQPGQTEPELRVVTSEHEMAALGSDWHESPADAKDRFTQLESDVAKAAAEANYQDRNMSELAKRERLAHERSTDEMVTSVPAKKKRGRPARVIPAVE